MSPAQTSIENSKESCICDSYWDNKNDLTYLKQNFTVNLTLRDKKSEILKCNFCNSLFIKHETIINKLNPNSLRLINNWNSSEQIFNLNLLELLKEIGIAEGWYKTIMIPCRAQTKANETIDFCLLVFTDLPPFQEVYSENHENVFMISEIANIYKSDYSLPYSIRKLTRNQREAGMGFSPTVLKSLDDKLFCLNGSHYFFKYGSIDPKELTVEEFSREKYLKDYILYDFKEKVNYIICDKNAEIENYKA